MNILFTLLREDYHAFMRKRDSWSPASTRRQLFTRRWNILVRDWMCHPIRTYREGVLDLQGEFPMLSLEERDAHVDSRLYKFFRKLGF